MIFQNYIFQSLIYVLAALFLLLTIDKNFNINNFYWTKISIFVIMGINAFLCVAYYLKLFFSKKEKPTILMTIDFFIKVVYIISFSIFCFI